jgi:hypothetical protein
VAHLLTGQKEYIMWLKLRWARFFTLAGWNWRLANRPGFDFIVTFPCVHSECSGSHTLKVRISEKVHEALVRKHEELYDWDAEQHPALFGDGPDNTHWQMMHGAGGGYETVSSWVAKANRVWERAAHE